MHGDCPPSTSISVPVIDIDKSDTRNSTNAAISVGFANRLNGMSFTVFAITSSRLTPLASAICFDKRVARSDSVGPGDMALIRYYAAPTLC